MTSHNEQVQPAPFEAAAPTTAETPAASAGAGTPSWVIPALLLLVVVAAAVVFWLPGQIAPNSPAKQAAPAATDEPERSGSDAPQAAKRAPAEEASPWSDAQAAKLRKSAQDVLAQVLELQLQLEERGVTQWAAEDFAAAGELASGGDELYRQRQFTEAAEAYAAARSAMQALIERIPGEMDQRLAQALEAIEALEPQAAANALDIATVIEPENSRLAGLRERAERLPQVIPLVEDARRAEAGGDLERALESISEAADAAPQHTLLQAERKRLDAAVTAQRFNDAMSKGYQALDESRFDSARAAFRRAAKLQPGSEEAASALRETAAAAAAAGLARLQSSGRDHEQNERWQEAVSAYEQALGIDPNVVFAREGLERARERAELDRQFRATLESPLRLSDPAVAKTTEKLLQEARAVEPRGAVLSRQLREVERLLELARTPIEVTLRSDERTEVILYKVQRLGRFDQRQLSLRPGTYTAVGTRIGYRDVRRTFTVTHEDQPEPVMIACTEPI